MVLCKKVFYQTSVIDLTRDAIVGKMKGKLIERTGKSIFLTAYVSYSNIIESLVAKLLSYVISSKTIIMLLVALL